MIDHFNKVKMAVVTETGSLYSTPVAFVYVFNLIIGVGALTMPKAFADAGWLVAAVFTCVLCFISFVTATFMVEAMAAANALLRLQEKKLTVNAAGKSVSSEIATDEEQPLLITAEFHGMDLYKITRRVEMGQMANLFFSKVGVRLFYFCIALYLYGDLAIYAAAVPKSLTRVACKSPTNETSSSSTRHCWGSITEINVYRVFLAIFTLTLGPFAFFNVQKTKYLQIFTSVMRWIAFILMIVLACVRIGKDKPHHDIPVAEFSGLPNFFGVCVYSFMCQHSIPSLITPMRSKSRVMQLFFADFAVVLVFYALLSFTGIFAFSKDDLKDLYTLNFWGTAAGELVGYFLALFPVFTLSTNFPIISITLRDNLKNLFFREGHQYSWAVDRIVFPLATITLPILVAFVTQNLEILVGVTGSYAGAGVQYVIPACLVYFGRKQVQEQTGYYDNKHRSPFSRSLWVMCVIAWAVVCVAFVTANHIITKK